MIAREQLAVWRERADAARTRIDDLADRSPAVGLPLQVFERYATRQGGLLASACAFRLFLWLLPLSLLVAGLLSGIAGSNQASIEAASKRIGIVGAASAQTAAALHEAHPSWWIATLVGLVAFVWVTRTLVQNLILVNAHAWGMRAPRHSQKDIAVTTAIIAGSWLLLLAVGTLILQLDGRFFGATVLAIVLQSAITGAIWWRVSLRLPDQRRDSLDLLPGSLLFGLAIAIVQAGSRALLPDRLTHASQLFGTLGVAATILLWLLVIGQDVVVCAMINSVWSDHRAARRNAPQ